jgi:hypothetical protein
LGPCGTERSDDGYGHRADQCQQSRWSLPASSPGSAEVRERSHCYFSLRAMKTKAFN